MPRQLASKFSICCSYFCIYAWRQVGKISLLKGVFFIKPSCWQLKWQASLSTADSLAGALLTCALGKTDWFNWQVMPKNLQRNWCWKNHFLQQYSAVWMQQCNQKLLKLSYLCWNQPTKWLLSFYFLRLCAFFYWKPSFKNASKKRFLTKFFHISNWKVLEADNVVRNKSRRKIREL